MDNKSKEDAITTLANVDKFGAVGNDKNKILYHSPNTRAPVVTRIWMHHHMIIQLIAQGKKNYEIADIMGMSKGAISRIKNSPLVKGQLAEMAKVIYGETIDVQRSIVEIAPEALLVLKDLMRNPVTHERLRKDIAERFVDHVAPPPKTIQGNINFYLTKDKINDIKERSKDAGFKRGSIVKDTELKEAEFEEVPSNG